MPRRDVATDNDSCPECGARFIAAPCRLCKGTGQFLLLFKCRDCGGAGKKLVCPNFLSHLRAQSGSQTSSPKRPPINDEDREASASSMVRLSRDFSASLG
jgi:RecJ-like exonuclease